MIESSDSTVVSDPADPGIIDAYGLIYRMTPNHQMTINGAIDRSIPYVAKLAYSQRQIWVMDGNRHWRSRRHHNDPWSQAADHSPVIADRLADISDNVQQVLSAVNNLPTGGGIGDTVARIDRNVTTMMGMVDQLETQVAVFSSNEARIAASVTALQDAVAKILDALSVHTPVRLELDLANVEISSQPVPGKPGL